MKNVFKKLAFAASTVAISLGVTAVQGANDPAPLVVPASGLISSAGLFGPGLGCNEAFVPGVCTDVFTLDLSAFSAAPAVNMKFDVRSLAFGPFVPVPGLMSALVDSGFSAIAFSNTNPATFAATVAPTASYSLLVMGSSPDATAFSAYSVAVSVTAVPEPQSYALMLAGIALVGLGVVRRRKQG